MSGAVSSMRARRVLRARPGWRAVDFRELWRYRELLGFLVWRDLKTRYRQTAIGAAWAILQPLGTMLVFTVVFGRVARLPSDGIPYSLFAYSGILPWMYFSGAVSSATNSLVGQSHLITKVYFPRLIIPAAASVTGLVDTFVALTILAPLLLWHHVVPPLSAIWGVPLVLLLAVVCALGVSLWLTALNVLYRDVRNAVPLLLQLWMFATPIVYPASLVPSKYRWALSINPMAGIISAFRSVVFGRPIDASTLLPSAAISLLLLGTGALYFRRVERVFADVV